MSLEDTKNLAEVFAFGSAAIFFLYKAITGYLITNLSISLSSSRHTAIDENTDWLTIVAKLTKGDRGSLDLHDAKVRVRWQEGEITERLIGYTRQGYKNEPVGGITRTIVDFDSVHQLKPFLRLSPGEETSFSCYVEIPSDQVCTIELTVIGKMRRDRQSGQWKASTISIPPNKNGS